MRSDSNQWIPLFPEEEVPHILAAVLRSGAQLRKLHGTELENDLSDRLRDQLDRDPGLRHRPVEVFREVPLFDRKRARQRQLGRPDIMFLYSTGVRKPWPYFVLESKRLHVTFPTAGWQSLISEYVTGDQGMMCFIVGRYARDLASGGMLGYVFDREVEEARSSIGASIEANHEQLRCCAVPRFGPSSVLKGDSRVSESTHSRPQGPFIIYHLFLAV
jgi:hypothetical protein